jgi:hypothetical protein
LEHTHDGTDRNIDGEIDQRFAGLGHRYSATTLPVRVDS